MDDEQLCSQLQQGDEAALAEIIQRYHRELYHFLCRFTGDLHLANDLVQEVFIRLMTAQREPPRRLRAWLYTVARNLARDHFRSAQYRYEQVTDFGSAQVEAQQGVMGEGASAQPTDEVVAALAQLTPDQREVILLRFYHDLKVDDIAEIIGLPAGTVKSRLFHTLKRLKGLLAQMETPYDR